MAADAGGTDDAFDVGSGTSAFVAALEEIRVRALSCEYVLPVPDPSEVRVVLGCILPPPR